MKKILIGTTFAVARRHRASAQTAAGPQGSDARWQPWLGCWQLLDESVREPEDFTAEAAAGVAPARPQRRVAARASVSRARAMASR